MEIFEVVNDLFAKEVAFGFDLEELWTKRDLKNVENVPKGTFDVIEEDQSFALNFGRRFRMNVIQKDSKSFDQRKICVDDREDLNVVARISYAIRQVLRI